MTKDGWIRDDSGTEYEIICANPPANGKPSISDYTLNSEGGEGNIYKIRESGGGNYWVFKEIRKYDNTKDKILKLREYYDKNHYIFDSVSSDFNIAYTWPISHVSSGYTLLGKRLKGGYIMKLHDLSNTLTCGSIRCNEDQNKDELNLDYGSLCDLGIKLCRAIATFHDSGYCYKDISRNNVRFNYNPSNTEKSVILIDSDNIGISGGKSDVEGTDGFTPPEIWKNQTSHTIMSDCFSVAAILFQMFIKGDPFECPPSMQSNKGPTDWDNYKKDHPVFVFDPSDKSNTLIGRDDTLEYFSWLAAPNMIKECFIKTFSRGLYKPELRTTMKEWVRVLSDVKYNGLKYCPSCGQLMARDGKHCLVCGADNLFTSNPQIAVRLQAKSFFQTNNWKITHDMFASGNKSISGESLSPTLKRYPSVLGFCIKENNGRNEYFITNKTDFPMSIVMIYGNDMETLAPGRSATLRIVHKIWIMNEVQVTFEICKA